VSEALQLFKLPARANVERAIAALKALNSELVHQLEADQLLAAKAALVFAYWSKRLHHDKTLLDRKREARLLARLRENDGDVSELLYVVDGAAADDWIMGRDVRSARRYDGIQTIFRDREQVERLAEVCTEYRAGRPHALALKYNLA
jgi:chorismate mutase